MAYTELEYIETGATAGAYIDTGLTATTDTYFKIDYQYTGTPPNNTWIFGCFYTSHEIIVGKDSGQLRAFIGGSGWTGTAFNTNRHTAEANATQFLFDDAQVMTPNWNNVPVGYPVYIFGRGGDGRYSPYTRIYSCQIYQGGVLVRDYIPAVDNEVVGLYDLVNDVFYSNAGSQSFTAGPVIVSSFTVQFNANGGSGTMADQSIPEGVPTPLNACTYTRDGYSFSGWSSYPSGPVEYADGETVTDLVAAGFLMPLYAIWELLPLQGTLYTNNSPINMMTKDLTSLATVNLIFKDTTNIIDPVFLFSGISPETIAACNYIYVAALGRYYFVNKIETVRNNVWQLYCHVDVLSTYADQVKEQYAIVKRQEQKFNKYVNDGVFKVYQYSNIETFPFSDGFSTIQYVLMVAGN